MPELPASESAPSDNQTPNGAVVTLDFVRHRNVLLVRGDLSPVFVDYYLHLADHGLKHAPAHDYLLRQALAAFTLHCASRPQREHLAWTIGLQEPRLNLFLAGDNEDCYVVGRLFTENVREQPHNVFYSDLMPRRGAEKRRSVVNFEGADIFHAAETYYAASEQRTARYFDLGDDHFALLISHPDCDEAWLKAVDGAAVKQLGGKETLARIERRLYQWRCGCTQQKILTALAPAAHADMGELFGEGESIHVQCPRCAAGHVITREAMEAVLAHLRPGGASGIV
ncbi:MAG: Hsp33 family molecular chaperone HslO [Opitutae bacterium]|nr:Hsp33 family molecular chaperone HslO [Opitutae bacterium]